MAIATLLVVVATLCCLHNTMGALQVKLSVQNSHDRTDWGENEIRLICEDDLTPILNAKFKRNGEPIPMPGDGDCTPSGSQYCYIHSGEQLEFIANSETEGKYTCEDENQTSDEIAIVAYPEEEFSGIQVKSGSWGTSLDLPCRFLPGPLANDGFYQHTWTTVSNGQYIPISSDDDVNYQDNNTDFTLTINKLSPPLARFKYLCGIEFIINSLQPYNLRDSANSMDNVIDVNIDEIEGDVSIVSGPSDVVVDAGEVATFSCTLNVTRNQTLQFQVFNATLHDELSGCDVDTSTNSHTHCSWPNDGIDMTCDYSVPYQITCILNVSGLTQANSTQVICSSMPGVAVSEPAGLAVRMVDPPTPIITGDENSENLTVSFTLPAIPFVPLDIEIRLIGETSKSVNYSDMTIDTHVVEIGVPKDEVPQGEVRVQIRIRYSGDDLQNPGNFSEVSNLVVVNPVPETSSVPATTTMPSSMMPETTIGPGTEPPPSNHLVYYILGAFGAVLLFIFIVVVILALLLYYRRDGRSAKVEFNGYGHTPVNQTPLVQIHGMKDNRSYSGSRSQSPPDDISNTNTTNTDVPEMSPSHHSHNGSCCCRMDHSSASEGSHRYLHVQQMSPRNLPRYGYPAEESTIPYLVHPPSLDLSITGKEQIPGISVQAPTPVTPANTEPFVPSMANTPEFTDPLFNPMIQTVRPGILHIPSSTSSAHNQPTPGTSTPISSEVALNIALYLMHKDCQLKDTCPTCHMIDNRFTKLLNRYETKAISKLASNSEAKSKLRHKHRQARSPRAAYAQRPHLIRQRSMSTSHVNEDELTLSSTETEDDGMQMDKDKRRRTKEGHTPPRNLALLSLRDIPKDIVASDSELASTPSGRSCSPRKATSPVKPTRPVHQLPVPSDSLSSNEDSQATDGSDTSSHKHNSQPDLNDQLPVMMTYLPNPVAKHHYNSTLNKHQSVVSTSGYSSQSDNESAVFRPVPISRIVNRTCYSDESVDDYHSDGYSYNGSYTDYPGQRVHPYHNRKVSLDTVVSNPTPNHYPGRHSLDRSGGSFASNGHSQLSVYSANAVFNHRPQNGRPSSASPSHTPYKSGMGYSSGKPHSRSMSPIILPTSQSRATPL